MHTPSKEDIKIQRQRDELVTKLAHYIATCNQNSAEVERDCDPEVYNEIASDFENYGTDLETVRAIILDGLICDASKKAMVIQKSIVLRK